MAVISVDTTLYVDFIIIVVYKKRDDVYVVLARSIAIEIVLYYFPQVQDCSRHIHIRFVGIRE